MIPFRAGFANRGEDGGWGIALTQPVDVTGTTSGSAGGQWRRQRWGRHCLPACAGGGRKRCLQPSRFKVRGAAPSPAKKEPWRTSRWMAGRWARSRSRSRGGSPAMPVGGQTAGPGASERIRIASFTDSQVGRKPRHRQKERSKWHYQAIMSS